MDLESQVCTSRQAHRLKELGVAQKSLFYWHDEFTRPQFGMTEYRGKQICNMKNETLSAFTVSELGLMLPTLGIATVKSNDGNGSDFFWCQCHYFDKHGTQSKNEAEARAEMLIWILEQKHNACTVEDVNQRLTQ